MVIKQKKIINIEILENLIIMNIGEIFWIVIRTIELIHDRLEMIIGSHTKIGIIPILIMRAKGKIMKKKGEQKNMIIINEAVEFAR